MIRYQDGFAEVFKLQITNSKYQMVRQAVRQAHGPEQGRRAHHPEPSRRVNHNDRNTKSQTCLGYFVGERR